MTKDETEMKVAFNLSVAALMLSDLGDRFPEKSRVRTQAYNIAGKCFDMLCDFPFKQVRHEEFWKSRKLNMALNREIHRLYYRQEPVRDAKGRFVKREAA